MFIKTFFLALITAFTPLLAWAHTGVDAGAHHGSFLIGFLHPLGGLDHISVAIAVGLWATRVDPRAWLMPIIFMSTMAVGALAGVSGLVLPATEWLIACSVLFCALLPLIHQSRVFSVVGLSVVALFAFAHGLAHGDELQNIPDNALTLAGLISCTGLLHVSGIVMHQRLLAQRIWLQRALSLAMSVLGLELLLSLSGVLS